MKQVELGMYTPEAIRAMTLAGSMLRAAQSFPKAESGRKRQQLARRSYRELVRAIDAEALAEFRADIARLVSARQAGLPSTAATWCYLADEPLMDAGKAVPCDPRVDSLGWREALPGFVAARHADAITGVGGERAVGW